MGGNRVEKDNKKKNLLISPPRCIRVSIAKTDRNVAASHFRSSFSFNFVYSRITDLSSRLCEEKKDLFFLVNQAG